MTGLAIGGLALGIAGAVGSAYAQSNAAKQQAALMDAQASVQDQQAALTRQQAEAQRTAAAVEAAQYGAQAAEHETQAKIAEMQAVNEQIKGEQEANKRSKILAADIGSTYANFAGNGLMLDSPSSGVDTIGGVLRTQVAEASQDISTINDNTAMAMWTHQANAAVERQSANHLKMAGKDALKMGDLNAALTMKSAGIQANQANLTRASAGATRSHANDAWWGALGSVGSSVGTFGLGMSK